MNILQDILGLITKGKVKPPTDKDYMVVASYTDAQEILKPQPKMQANLINLGALKKYIQSSAGTTPTLQQVLDNNHDLVDSNNFQGTGAGIDNTGAQVNAFGFNAARENTGNSINALGVNTCYQNTGNNSNFLGEQAGSQNTGESVNAMGAAAGLNNTFNSVNLFGQSATADEDGQTVLSKDGNIMARISTTDLTATRKYNLPDDDGTIALTTYKVYTALVSCVGTFNPTAIELENTTNATLSLNRLGNGYFEISSDINLFTNNKVAFFTNVGPFESGKTINCKRINNTVCECVTNGLSGNVDVYENATLEIRIYN